MPAYDAPTTAAELQPAACFCGSHATPSRTVYAKDEVGGQHFTYVTCAACGAERLSPRPGPEAIGAYYPDTYASHMVRPNSLASRVKRLTYLAFYAPDNRLGWQRPFWRALLYPVRGHTVFAFHAVEPRRIYEFGAATGNDLMLFREEGWEVDGSEPSARACMIAAERGITLQTAPAEAVDLPPASVSAILINNVLEHTHNPANVIAMSWRGLVPGGSLVVVVPNHASLSARIFGASWPGYDAPRHLWGFTPASLGALMRQVGFQPPKVYQMFQGRWAWRACLDGRHAAAPVPAWRRRWAQPLSLALYPLGILASLFGYGDFMTVVATKPAR